MQTRTQTSVYIGDVYTDGHASHASHRSREFVHVYAMNANVAIFTRIVFFLDTLLTTCTMLSRPLTKMCGRSHADVKMSAFANLWKRLAIS